MALVTYKDLCIDATDPVRMGEFWAAALGLRGERCADGGMVLRGTDAAQTVWINPVPDAKSAKHRVHLDVFATSLDDFADRPRLSRAGEFPWTVLADPEGGEFCVFVRDDLPVYRLKDLEVDAADSAALCAWWSTVIGGTVVHDDGYSYLGDVPGIPFGDIDFVPVPEPKSVKNRIHWDVTLVPGAAVADLIAHGASLVRATDADIEWTVMADPEGNEFCVFAAP